MTATHAPDLTMEALERLARGESADLNVHLTLVERDVALTDTKAVVHCHHLAIDANGRAGVRRLAEFMRDCVLEYAISRSLARAAFERAARPGGSMAALMALHEQAKSLFTSLARTGEGGELLLFLLAERFLERCPRCAVPGPSWIRHRRSPLRETRETNPGLDLQ